MKKFYLICCFCLLFLCSYGFSSPKVYDCFLFYDEMEILKCRLAELDPYVDFFVLVESCETFQGGAKPLYFDKHRDEFAKYLHKIIHVPLRSKQSGKIPNAWARENFQRQQLQDIGLRGCAKNDIVMISDVDEIPRGSLLPSLFQRTINNGSNFILWQFWTAYYMNRIRPNSYGPGFPEHFWAGTVITTFKYLRKHPVRSLRANRDRLIPRKNWIKDGGWHFSSCGGGFQRMIRKLESWSHVECNVPQNKTFERWQRCVNGHVLCEIDNTFPQYVIDNMDYLIQEGYIDVTLEH